MNLYEVVNGYIGQSYVRVYVCAKSEPRALELAQDTFKRYSDKLVQDIGKNAGYEKQYWTNLRAKPLFLGSNIEFVTEPSDCGWDVC